MFPCPTAVATTTTRTTAAVAFSSSRQCLTRRSRSSCLFWQPPPSPNKVRMVWFARHSSSSSSSRSKTQRWVFRRQRNYGTTPPKTHSTSTRSSSRPSVVQIIKERPIEYATIPFVAAFVGIMTNWMGVKMLFYPIEYVGCNIFERPLDGFSPYGYFGWQGVVPTKTKIMGTRLCNIVTQQLLSLPEAFDRIHPNEFSTLILPIVSEFINNECGPVWHQLVTPLLPFLLPRIIIAMQNDITNLLDLQTIVLEAFVRDKEVLVELFQKVGRVELEFLVNSGFTFGFGLGLLQMMLWAKQPRKWTLPVAGALVGYVTNWIAIKLLFEPADPVELVPNVIQIQGLFESRQLEVSEEFGFFMQQRVLNSPALLQALSEGSTDGKLYLFLRNQLPYPIPESVVMAAYHAIETIAKNPKQYPEIHTYVTKQLDIQDTLSVRLKQLSPTKFEDLLHPVFQEDEATLIVTGGILGAIAGLGQTKLGWGGPKAKTNALITISLSILSSIFFYIYQKVEEIEDMENPPISATVRPGLQRRETIVRILPLEDEEDWEESNTKHKHLQQYQ